MIYKKIYKMKKLLEIKMSKLYEQFRKNIILYIILLYYYIINYNYIY